MADNLHLWLAAFVFLMLLIGVTLTILEFRRGLRDSEARCNRDGSEARWGGVGEPRSGGRDGDV